MTLNEMKPENVAIVTGYETGDDSSESDTMRQYRAKLLALGLTRGTKVRFISQAPLGDPIKIEVRGFELSLRKEEASILTVRQIAG